jgi:tetratricopeptide (TPR) repeat protein
MASIIPGYEYDIFISYRQKDNKYDGWVTEFVDNLKKELEATFKEDISIYFDENPHDGILETYNVDKSLGIKLKSLVCIPVISQTYCDPKSFAWQYEFVAFNKMAREDQFGRDIKLSSGNVASRIIPVKIHDIDASDNELLENELVCKLRSIEFIYRSAGVNRPLKPSDNPDKNLNKTFYRDQINKVANAIKEIIYSLNPDSKKQLDEKESHDRELKDYTTDRSKSGLKKLPRIKRKSTAVITIASLAILLILSVVIYIPRLIQRTKTELSASELIKKAIAVLPVANNTGNPELEYMAAGIQDAIIGHLWELSSLVVKSAFSTSQFRNSKEPIQEIAKKLSANNIVESSISGSGDSLIINVRLIQVFPVEKYVWSSTFNQNRNNITTIYRDITRSIADGIHIKFTPEEDKKLSKARYEDPGFIDAYNKGKFWLNQVTPTPEGFEKGLKYLNAAIAIDPTDPKPYLALALGYSNAGHVSAAASDASNRAKAYALKALELDSTLAEAYTVLAARYLYTEWDFPAVEHALKRSLALNQNLSPAHYTNAWFLALTGKNDEAISEMIKAVEIDPLNPYCTSYLAWLYFFTGRNKEAIEEARKTLDLDPNYTTAYYVMGSAYSEMGMHYEAIEMHKKGLAISQGYEQGLGIAYARAGQKEKALEVAAGMEKNIDSWWYAFGLAEVYATLGEGEKAIDRLEVAYKLHGDFVPWMKYDINLKTLYNNPRFKNIVNRLNLPV